MIKRTCKICEKIFWTKPAYIKYGGAKYCTHECYAKSLIGIKRPPEVCKMISLHNARSNLGKKMSDEQKQKISKSRKGKCVGKDHHNWVGKEKRNCIICNKVFIILKTSTQKFCSFSCYQTIRTKKQIILNKGYIYIFVPEHPLCSVNGYVSEHRLNAEKVLGRFLKIKEVIHHIDGNTQNNHSSNLYLFPNQIKHVTYHNNPHPKITKSNLTSQ